MKTKRLLLLLLCTILPTFLWTGCDRKDFDARLLLLGNGELSVVVNQSESSNTQGASITQSSRVVRLPLRDGDVIARMIFRYNVIDPDEYREFLEKGLSSDSISLSELKERHWNEKAEANPKSFLRRVSDDLVTTRIQELLASNSSFRTIQTDTGIQSGYYGDFSFENPEQESAKQIATAISRSFLHKKIGPLKFNIFSVDLWDNRLPDFFAKRQIYPNMCPPVPEVPQGDGPLFVATKRQLDNNTYSRTFPTRDTEDESLIKVEIPLSLNFDGHTYSTPFELPRRHEMVVTVSGKITAPDELSLMRLIWAGPNRGTLRTCNDDELWSAKYPEAEIKGQIGKHIVRAIQESTAYKEQTRLSKHGKGLISLDINDKEQVHLWASELEKRYQAASRVGPFDLKDIKLRVEHQYPLPNSRYGPEKRSLYPVYKGYSPGSVPALLPPFN